MVRTNCKIMKSLITAEFEFCPSLYLVHCRALNGRLDFISYIDRTIISQQVMMEEDNSVSIQHINLQLLTTEML